MLEAGQIYEGGCLCGAIRYRTVGPSLFATQCCCRDCQRATGTGHTTIVGVLKSQLTVHGTPRVYTNSGESGGMECTSSSTAAPNAARRRASISAIAA